ncbi:MAG: VOC family protein [Bacteroidetes bacterium]|nr:VOC family protein [Bacteroidota bacterium]
MKFIPTILSLLLLIGFQSQTNAQNNQPKVTIDHVALFVVDLQKEQTFYRDIMQLDSLAEPFHDNKHAWFSIGNGVAMHIIQGAQQPKEYFKNNHLCFSVVSLTDFTQRLLNQKISFEDVTGKQNAITTRIDGVHQIWLKDPEGYWIEVNDAKH